MRMPLGKYKDWPMNKVPSFYLIKLYSQKEIMNEHPAVNEYIETAYSALLSPNGAPVILEMPLCQTSKVCYIDEEAAKKALKLIKQDKRNHKKPDRTYQCELCSYWHLTSKPL